MNNKIKQFIAFGVASVVALVVCSGVLVVTVKNLDGDESSTENKEIISKTELESSKECLTEYINGLIEETNGRFVKTKAYTDVSVNELTVLNEGETKEADQALLNFAKEKMLSAVDCYYSEDAEGTFKKTDSKKLSLAIDKNAIKKADFSIGQVDENGESVLDDAGKPVDNEYYYLTYEINVANKSYNKKLAEMFSVNDDVSAKEQFVNDVKDNCKIKSFKAIPDSFIIKAKVNRTNNEIQYINVIKNYAVTINASFINDAGLFGEKEISFIYTVTDTYEYSYAGISFVEDEVTIELDEEYMLNVNAVIDDDSEYSVEFSSSMDDVVSVDEMGYVKGLKNTDAPTTITVKLKYLGETFTDTCIVNVTVKEVQ